MIERVGLRLGVEDDLQVILESDDLQPPEISVEGLPVSVAHLSPAGALTLAGSLMDFCVRPGFLDPGMDLRRPVLVD